MGLGFRDRIDLMGDSDSALTLTSQSRMRRESGRFIEIIKGSGPGKVSRSFCFGFVLKHFKLQGLGCLGFKVYGPKHIGSILREPLRGTTLRARA